MNPTIALSELESAINYWRKRSPSVGEEARLCLEAAALAEPYAAMIMARAREMALDDLQNGARQAFELWRQDDGRAAASTA